MYEKTMRYVNAEVVNELLKKRKMSTTDFIKKMVDAEISETTARRVLKTSGLREQKTAETVASILDINVNELEESSVQHASEKTNIPEMIGKMARDSIVNTVQAWEEYLPVFFIFSMRQCVVVYDTIEDSIDDIWVVAQEGVCNGVFVYPLEKRLVVRSYSRENIVEEVYLDLPDDVSRKISEVIMFLWRQIENQDNEWEILDKNDRYLLVDICRSL